MAQFSKTRINRVYKRSGPKQKQRPYNSQSRPAPEPSIPSEDEEPIEPSDVDSESDSETKSRPYNTLLDIFKINPEKQGRSRKRRKLDKAQAYASSDEDEDDIIDEEDDGQYLEVEEEEVEVAEDPESDTEEAKDDPFETHINAPEATEIASRVQALQSNGWTNSKRAFGSLGDCTIYSPKETKIHNQLLGAQKGLISASGMKKKLEVAAERVERDFSETTKALSPYIFGYSDVLFGARTPQNSPSLRQATCLHVLNHVFKTRDKVVKHNSKLAGAGDDTELAFRDQGFTRPKVLFILPTRGACAKIIDTIVELCQPEQQENRKRFEDNFLSADGEVSADRPDDFKDLFDGNDDDMFRIGIKFTRKTVKFFTQFYNSDIILASPLGLRSAIDGGEGKKKDYDYLSSIEIVVVDQTDALLMQNWDHVTFVMQHLNLSPKEAHGCDFSRVRMWYLDDNAKHLRQTIVLSSFITPEINSLFSKYMMNVSGKIKYQANYDGSMLTTGLPLKQTFARYHSSNIQSDPDTRFKFFTSTVVPWMLRQPRPAEGGLGILIFIPSYFDFVRVKNYFQTSPTVSSLSFATVTENKSPAEPETRRARSHFLTGKSSVMLYTGRAHHFYRYMMKGVKSVVMYQLPDNPLFYREIVAGFLGASVTTGRISGEEGSVRAMFSKWDALRLERIVGTERLRTMLGAGDTFDFI